MRAYTDPMNPARHSSLTHEPHPAAPGRRAKGDPCELIVSEFVDAVEYDQ